MIIYIGAHLGVEGRHEVADETVALLHIRKVRLDAIARLRTARGALHILHMRLNKAAKRQYAVNACMQQICSGMLLSTASDSLSSHRRYQATERRRSLHLLCSAFHRSMRHAVSPPAERPSTGGAGRPTAAPRRSTRP